MSTKKNIAIQELTDQFIEFGNSILSQLELLKKAIINPDNLDDNVFNELLKLNEDRFDKFEVKISNNIVKTIVLYQPVASDLRKIMAMYRMTTSLERIGDIVMNNTKLIKKIKDSDVYIHSTDVVLKMLETTIEMVHKSLLSFSISDKEYALWTIKNDSLVDEMNNKLLKKAIVDENISDENKIMLTSFINIKSIISNIERIADHATNIAEASIYSLEGTDLRHKK